MTGGKVSNRIKEQYPWGRYRWLDSLLGLPTKRQRLFISHRIATSPLSNALGCLVFLGTPFYVKKWEKNGVRWLVLATVASIVVMLMVMWGYAMLVSYAIRSAVAKRSVDAPYLTPLIASALILVFATISVSIELSPLMTTLKIAPYLTSLIVCLILAFTSRSPRPSTSPDAQPSTTPVITATSHHRTSPLRPSPHTLSSSPAGAAFYSTSSNTTSHHRTAPLLPSSSPSRSPAAQPSTAETSIIAFYSGNIYHSPDFDWSHAMSALVVHAGKLDEASLALSSEPIARAYVFPHLANMLKLPFWKPLPQFPPHDAVPLDWLLYFASFGRILLWNIIFILPAMLLSLLSHVVAPLVIGAVRNVIVVISFGLAQNELSFAHVFMDEVLDLGLSSQHVEHWNVQVSSCCSTHCSFGLAQNELSFAHIFMDKVLHLGLSSQHVEHWNVQVGG
ncbi:unnamed protein product [Closterium sp. Yama58-4]|nr:unnamed protein product [Closterium sp. Yama58-4]